MSEDKDTLISQEKGFSSGNNVYGDTNPQMTTQNYSSGSGIYSQQNPQTNTPPNSGGNYQPPNINPPPYIPKEPIPQQNPQQVAPIPVFTGIQYSFVADPMQELAEAKSVLIRQLPQFGEQYTGCESPNRYYVFSHTFEGYKLLFMCKEISSCCMRNCCRAEQRGFHMIIKHVNNVYGFANFDTHFATLIKPCKCTCCCCNRPEMDVILGNNQYCGRITQPYTCCDPEFHVYSGKGNSIEYVISADCCQCGLLCANRSCGKLSEAEFLITRYLKPEVKLGSIIKQVATVSELVTSADSYQISFPVEASPEDKLLLISAGLMIDYQFFEESASENNQRG